MQVFRYICPQLRDQGFLLRFTLPTGSSYLCDDGAGGGRLVLPVGGEDADGLVVAGQTVDTGLDENQAELGVLVLAVTLEVLADGDSLVISLIPAR